ncbi:MAG: DEAD/DEAH box helicase, partial [Synergistaceae bacterium]|nr:DEAD/DEAH box helicase [Synergistaceae bacterium]
MNSGEWYYSTDHGQLCQVIEAQTLWGDSTCRIWLPGRDSVVRIPATRLEPLERAGTASADNIVYVAAAARVADALTQDVLLAPIESSVIPLPHQIRALSRAIANDRVRYLLADEVGMGKTIEAGLILRELKLRGMVKRTLVIAPKGLVSQWVSEMRFHFGETFQLVLPEDIKTLKRIAPATGYDNAKNGNYGSEVLPANAWQIFSQVVVPMDSVKPLDKIRGWTAAQVNEHNRERFEDLISAG